VAAGGKNRAAKLEATAEFDVLVAFWGRSKLASIISELIA
jgi:hypothetical protein